ncbi:MAG: YqaE/Pmp3 family membrane protein [Bacteroidetes bacterium]|nr:YqaE/Pmp3 family membrane protein [Bacteroidota bacterium]
MKSISVRTLLFLFITSTLVSSCAFLHKEEFAQRKYYNFPRTKHSNEGQETEHASVKFQDKTQSQTIVGQRENKCSETLVSASITQKEIIIAHPEINIYSTAEPKVINTLKATARTEVSVNYYKKSDILKHARKNLSHFSFSDAGLMMFMMVLAAIFIPPLGVYIKDMPSITNWFWITLILCILSGGIWIGGITAGAGLWFIAAIIALLHVFDII